MASSGLLHPHAFSREGGRCCIPSPVFTGHSRSQIEPDRAGALEIQIPKPGLTPIRPKNNLFFPIGNFALMLSRLIHCRSHFY